MKPYYRILRLNHGRAPTVQHATLKDAETEALRLAGQHPGETFEILQCLGVARTTEPSIFWNDGVEPPAPTVDPGEGYRLVDVGETLDGSEDYLCGGEWLHRSFGKGLQHRQSDAPTRRKLPAPGMVYWEAVKDEPSYRMLEPGERIEEGDELDLGDGEWVRRSPVSIGDVLEPHYAPTRRPIKKP